jgi:hypothetical protein
MRVMFRKALAGALVAATMVGGSSGAVQARTGPVSTAQQVAGGSPVENVGYYYRRRGFGGAGVAFGAATLGFGLGALAASSSYGYGLRLPGLRLRWLRLRLPRLRIRRLLRRRLRHASRRYAPRYYRPAYGVRRVYYGGYGRGYGGYGRGYGRAVYGRTYYGPGARRLYR